MLDLLSLQCMSRDSGETREVVLAKKELQVRDERIKGLEEAMRQRAEVQELMAAEQQQMLRQWVIATRIRHALHCIWLRPPPTGVTGSKRRAQSSSSGRSAARLGLLPGEI